MYALCTVHAMRLRAYFTRSFTNAKHTATTTATTTTVIDAATRYITTTYECSLYNECVSIIIDYTTAYMQGSALTRNAKSTRFQDHRTVEGSVEGGLLSSHVVLLAVLNYYLAPTYYVRNRADG